MTKEEPERIKQGYQPSPSKNANVIPPNAGSHVRREKHIADLEKENAELKDKLKNLESVAEVRLANWQKYEKENKELKKKIENLQKYLDTRNCYRECAENWVKLTKTKELLEKLYNETQGYINDQGFDIKILAETEQFLKESE